MTDGDRNSKRAALRADALCGSRARAPNYLSTLGRVPRLSGAISNALSKDIQTWASLAKEKELSEVLLSCRAAGSTLKPLVLRTAQTATHTAITCDFTNIACEDDLRW